MLVSDEEISNLKECTMFIGKYKASGVLSNEIIEDAYNKYGYLVDSDELGLL